MLAADSVAINRLQIKGDKRTSQALVRELEQTSWSKPMPAHLQQAWVLVRELQVKGKARDLRQQTAQELDGQLQSAVRAIDGNAATANAIWFASFPELIAFLLVDLAIGKATQWYWSRWAYLLNYPKHEAIARLLCEHSEHLPSIIMQLQSRQQLAVVWEQLSDGSAKTIVRELLKSWNLPNLGVWQTDLDIQQTETNNICLVLQTQSALLSYWRPLLKGLPIHDGRVLLAAVLHGLMYTPLWLQKQPAALIQAFSSLVIPLLTDELKARTSQNAFVSMPDGKVIPEKKHTALVEQFGKQSSGLIMSSKDVQVGKAAIVNGEKSGKEMIHSQPRAEEVSSPEKPQYREANQTALASAIDGYKFQGVTDSVESLEEFSGTENLPTNTNLMQCYEFITRAGGFFYLLNPFHRMLNAERLATQQEASVWHWLLDLYRVFAQHFPVLDDFIDPPLLRFMLQQLQPGATPTELQQLSLQIMSSPPTNFAVDIFGDLQKHFVNTDFWRELQSSPGFFATPARVIATASHWDIYFPLSAVRLDLRLAAWDVNPGWLPWLGRVVSLHYIEQPILADAGAAS